MGQQLENTQWRGNLTLALQGFTLRAGIYLAQAREDEREAREWSGAWRG